MHNLRYLLDKKYALLQHFIISTTWLLNKAIYTTLTQKRTEIEGEREGGGQVNRNKQDVDSDGVSEDMGRGGGDVWR